LGAFSSLLISSDFNFPGHSSLRQYLKKRFIYIFFFTTTTTTTKASSSATIASRID
jgi:hypothetical protein